MYYLSTCVVWRESFGLCDLNVTSLRTAHATRHIRCVLLVNSQNKLDFVAIDLYM